MESGNFEIIVKTLYGLEEVLAEELRRLGITDLTIGNRAVTFKGDKKSIYLCNLHLRTAISVLRPLVTFNAKNEDELYKKTQQIEWDQVFKLRQTFSVEPVVHSSVFKHSQYAALKVKDSIVDQFRKKTNYRPYVDPEKPEIAINLHISENSVTLSLNSSGDPLFKRGYRVATQEAPLNEALAAGLILLSGWNGDSNFVDPMCGSGTLLIEAALIANKIPPGIFRKKFCFENWMDFDEDLFRSVSTDDEHEDSNAFKYKIIGSDISPKAIGTARANVKNAFLQNKIDLIVSSMENLTMDVDSGIIITNPPYGERIKPANINSLYKNLGDSLKKKFEGFDAWILSSHKDAMKHLGLHPSKKIKLMNGALECNFTKFEIYKGSKKAKKNSKSSIPEVNG